MFNVKLVMMGILAVGIALKADIASPDFPDAIEGYVNWVLSGMIAGLTVMVGPELAEGVKGMLKIGSSK